MNKVAPLLFIHFYFTGDAPDDESEGTPIEKLGKLNNIVVLLCHGGYFSAAVFQGKNVVAHKTFHHYVTRKKQGGRQSSKDKTGKKPKSGGASIRRYNEQKHLNEIRELFKAWKQYLNNADLIFTHIPQSNRGDFFHDAKNSSEPSKLIKTSKGCYYFQKDDERVRPLPFSTQRPNYAQVRQVFVKLTSVVVSTTITETSDDDCERSEGTEEFLSLHSSLRSSTDFVFAMDDDEEDEEDEFAAPEEQSSDDE